MMRLPNSMARGLGMRQRRSRSRVREADAGGELKVESKRVVMG